MNGLMWQTLNTLSVGLNLVALYLLGEKKKICFPIFITCNIIYLYMVIFLIRPFLWSGVVLTCIYMFFNTVNYFKWKRSEDKK